MIRFTRRPELLKQIFERLVEILELYLIPAFQQLTKSKEDEQRLMRSSLIAMLPDANVGNFPEQRFAGPLGHAETLNLQPQPKATKKAATNPAFASLWRKRVGEVNKGSKEDLALSACSCWRHWLTSGSDDVSAIALAKVETWTVRGIIAKQFDKFGSF
jgi:hypothetical protein